MKRLSRAVLAVAALLGLPALASAQAIGHYQNILLSNQGTPAAGRQVYVCTQPATVDANGYTGPCSPLATLYVDATHQSYTITSIVRASNVVVVTTSIDNAIPTGQTVAISGVSDTSFDGSFVVTAGSNGTSNSFTYSQDASNASSTGGTVAAANPFYTDSNGDYGWYSPNGYYTVKIVGGGIHLVMTDQAVFAPTALTLQTNGTANANQTVLDFLNSTTNSEGLSVTFSSDSSGGEKAEISGSSYGGNAATASALATTPTLCPTGEAPLGILANGNATGCWTPSSGGVSLSTANTWTATQSFEPSSGDDIDFLDSSGNKQVEIASNGSNAVNVNIPTGYYLNFQGNGSELFYFNQNGIVFSAPTVPLVWQSPGGYGGTFEASTLTANRTWTLPDAGGTVCIAGAGTSGCGGSSGVTEATLGTCVHIFGTTAGQTGCKYYLTQAHTLVRLYANVDSVPSGCTTVAVVALWDVTTGSAVASLTIANGGSADDSSTLSASMPANHVYDWNVTTAAAGCSTSPQLYMSATYE